MNNIKRVLNINLAMPWRVNRNTAVAPCTLMTMGVRSGSKGACLWKSTVLSDKPERWNGIPVVINHPTAYGAYVSVNFNDETKSKIIGYVQNAKWVGVSNSLKAEIHVNLSNPNLPSLQQIKEVSIGVFSSEVEETGIFNKQTYESIITEYEPDHLALLPNDVGACSWADGCGIRVNSQKMKRKFASNSSYQSNNNSKEVFMNEVLLPTGMMVNEKKEDEQQETAANLDDFYLKNVLPPIQINCGCKLYKPAFTEGGKNNEPEILLPNN